MDREPTMGMKLVRKYGDSYRPETKGADCIEHDIQDDVVVITGYRNDEIVREPHTETSGPWQPVIPASFSNRSSNHSEFRQVRVWEIIVPISEISILEVFDFDKNGPVSAVTYPEAEDEDDGQPDEMDGPPAHLSVATRTTKL
jgi:hypothetical protein